MKIVCPTCNTRHRVSGDQIPQQGGALATCKKCGGQIPIEPTAKERPDSGTRVEPALGPTISDTHEPPPSLTPKTREFELITEYNQFRGYAGFWKRFVAVIIDGFVLTAVGLIIGSFIGSVYGFSRGTSQGAGAAGNIIGIIVGWLYFAIMESSSKQGTLGKMALGIKVTDLSGNAIPFGTATVRHFSKIISTIILLAGYLMVAFTPKKQGLHDIVAGCLVVNRR